MSSRSAIPSRRDHAVVVGGSMAGLLAARVLADHFARVTIIERDRLPSEPSARKGVPQARHAHQILTRGLSILEGWFPALAEDLVAAGAQKVDHLSDTLIMTAAGRAPRPEPGVKMIACSRDLLEWSVRRYVAALSRVQFMEECDVVGLDADPSGAQVLSVRVQTRARVGGGGHTSIRADLVVDASGRSSQAPRWLEALGHTGLQETIIDGFVRYASRVYQPPAGFKADWKLLSIPAQAPNITRLGLLFPIEGDRWLVTVAGISRDYPPTDEEGFMRFVRGLQHPMLHDLLGESKPLSPIYGYQRMENRLRHYERMTSFPEGFITLGDAVCAFNPIYGQGITASALGAQALDRCLKEPRRAGLSRRFQRELAKVITLPWLMSTGADLGFPATEGARPGPIVQLAHRYLDTLLRLAWKDPSILRAYVEVGHLVKAPWALFHPVFLVKVLRHEARAIAAIAKERLPDEGSGSQKQRDMPESA